MAVTAVKGKQCTFTIGTTTYQAFITNRDISGEKSNDTIATSAALQAATMAATSSVLPGRTTHKA